MVVVVVVVMSNKHDMKMIGIAGLIGLAVFASAMLPAFATSAFTANPQSVTTTYNTAINITLTGTGPTPHYYVIDSQPSNGTLSNLDNVTGFVTYTPNNGYVGSDSFTFYKTDGAGDNSDPATVDITVRPQPVTADLAYTTPYFTAVNVQLVVVNGATFQITQQPAHGQITSMDANTGALVYKPSINFAGVDTFKFVTTDGVNTSNESTVTITVQQAVGNGGFYVVAGAISESLHKVAANSPIPESATPLYQAVNNNLRGVLFASMVGADWSLDGGWNHLTEGQQAWILDHFDDLVMGRV